MTPAFFVILHGFGLEITLLEYLIRVVLYLFAFGGIAVVVFWWLEGVSAIHSGVGEKWSGEKNDP